MKSYKEIDGWFDYEDLYEKFSNILKDNDKFVEVGVWKGRSICFLGQLLVIKDKKPEVFAVDTFKGSQNEEAHLNEVDRLGGSTLPVFKRHLNELGLEGIISPIEKESVEASHLFEDNSLAGVFIDANHSYEGVSQDIKSWYPKVVENGWMAGHDWDSEEVSKAVNDYFDPLRKLVIHYPPSCWVVAK